MKTKTAKVMGSLVAFGLSMVATPALADKQVVEAAEKKISKWAADHGKNSRMYGVQMVGLCSVYIDNGMFDEADETFNKAIEAQKSNDKTNFELPGLYTNYAMNLYQASAKAGITKKTQQDLRARAQKVTESGLVEANKLPPTSAQKLYYLLGMIDGYKIAGMKAEEQAKIKSVDPELRALEQNSKLSAQEVLQVAQTLIRMAGYYCPSPMYRAARMMPRIMVVSDTSPDRSQSVKESDFKNAEAYQLRAMAMYNKLPENDVSRIEAQRSLVHWYHLYFQTKQEEYQIQQLSKLLHTTDRDKLFPQPAPCPACGMG